VNDRIGTLQASRISGQGLAIEDQKHIADGQSQTIAQQKDQISHLTDELQSMTKRAAELEVKAQDAERGVADTYDFNGVRRLRTAGRMGSIGGEETVVFQKIQKLLQDGAWSALKDACEAQIVKTPTWLTPYLFGGIADANLGDFAKAIDRLHFVVTKAGNDPAYAEASNVLAQVKAAQAGSPKPK
jgi:hypothetical protein